MQEKFPQELRLKTPAQFKCLFEKARKINSKIFRIFFYANSLSHPRLGIIAAKKNLKHACVRNSFKRIVRESFRHKQHQLKNYDYLVFAYKEAQSTSKKELRQCLDMQLEKLGKLENK